MVFSELQGAEDPDDEIDVKAHTEENTLGEWGSIRLAFSRVFVGQNRQRLTHPGNYDRPTAHPYGERDGHVLLNREALYATGLIVSTQTDVALPHSSAESTRVRARKVRRYEVEHWVDPQESPLLEVIFHYRRRGRCSLYHCA